MTRTKFSVAIACLALWWAPAHSSAAAPAVADTQLTEAAELSKEGRFEDAAALLEKAYRSRTVDLGAEHPDTLDAAKRLAQAYSELGQYEKTETLIAAALKVRERISGPNHAETLALVAELGLAHLSQGERKEAKLLFQRALKGRERTLGAEHVDTLLSLTDLGMVHLKDGEYDEAEPHLRRALEIRERTLGADHADTWLSLTTLVEVNLKKGELRQAEQFALRAAEVAKRLFGPEHRDTMWSMNDLATAYVQQGRFGQAEAIFSDVLKVRERVLGADHRDTQQSVNDLAILYQKMGAYKQAEPLYLRAIESARRRLGPQHAETLIATNNLARFYALQGLYAKAEPLYLSALSSLETSIGPEHADTLGVRNNLGALRRDQGLFGEAGPLLLAVLEARERKYGPDHPNTLLSVNNLAGLYRGQGLDDRAEPLYLRALDARERTLGKEHPDTLASADQLAAVYLAQQRREEAMSLLMRTTAARERTLGAEHPDTLSSFHRLATLHLDQGRTDDAALLFERVASVRSKKLGEDHPDSLDSLASLARLRRLQGRTEDAQKLLASSVAASARTLGGDHPASLARTHALTELLLTNKGKAGEAITPARLLLAGVRERRAKSIAGGQFAAVQNEREQVGQAAHFALAADAAWAAAEGGADQDRLRAEAFAALQEAMSGTANRAIVRMAARRAADAAGAGLGALVRERESLEDEWAANNERISQSFGSAVDAAEVRERLIGRRAEIEARMKAIEASLSADFPDYFALIRPAPLDIGAAQALLGPDEAMLLVLPTDYGTQLVALTRGRVRWARAGWTRREVHEAVRELRWDLGATVDPEWARAQADAAAAPSFDRKTAHALYQQVIAPVAPTLAGASKLYVVAGGSLSGLPFSVLVSASPDGSDKDDSALRSTRWFGDDFALTHVPSIQSLKLLRRAPRRAAGGAASFAGFGDPLLDGEAQQRGLNRGAGAPDAKAVLRRGVNRSGGASADVEALRNLARLPGTATELENMRSALGAPKSAIRLAAAATEGAVRTADLRDARILAFATHGLTPGELDSLSEPGLVFTPPEKASETDDGYLAASEVAALRLNADWVILSACNTASGDGPDAQGLSGLARAFFYAGARNLLASHWPVDDMVAARMTVRTIELERSGASRAEALQRAMREIRDVEASGSQVSWAHPGYWAPFTLIGDGGG